MLILERVRSFTCWINYSMLLDLLSNTLAVGLELIEIHLLIKFLTNCTALLWLSLFSLWKSITTSMHYLTSPYSKVAQGTGKESLQQLGLLVLIIPAIHI